MARHDAVAWSYARAADDRGVEIHQHTEVTGFLRDAQGAVTGVETTRGLVRAKTVALATAGNTSHVAAKAGLALPLVTRNLQAFVSEPIKPIIDVIVNCPDIGLYVMQSDKGELVIGGGTDPTHLTGRRPFCDIRGCSRVADRGLPPFQGAQDAAAMGWGDRICL